MKLAVLFPGIGYHCDKPLLYYAKKLVTEYGCDEIVSLSYSFDQKLDLRNNDENMKICYECLYEQAKEQLDAIALEQYNEIVFVSKSIGTIIAASYAKNANVKCKQVLYTPLKQTFSFFEGDAIAFIGTKDPWSDVDDIVELAKEKGVLIEVYEGLNHSLEKDDVLENLVVLKDVMSKTKVYLEEYLQSGKRGKVW